MRGPQHRFPVLNLVAAERPTSNRERLEDVRDRFRAMDREALEFELTVLTDTIAEMRASLEAGNVQQTRAYHRKNAEARLAYAEKHRRDAEADVARQERAQANLERQQQLKREADARKLERIREADRRNDRLLTAFIQEAKHQLPSEVYERIWTAANARRAIES